MAEGFFSFDPGCLLWAGLAVQFSPNGKQVAALTSDSQIQLFDWRDASQSATIEARLDLDPGRGDRDQITAQKSAKAK